MNDETSRPSQVITPPGPRGLPIFGSLLSIRNDPHLALHRISRQYGDVCSLRFGSVATVVISHPDLLREAFDQAELSDRWMSEMSAILTHHHQELGSSFRATFFCTFSSR